MLTPTVLFWRLFLERRENTCKLELPIRIDDAVMWTTEPWAVKLRDQRNIGDLSGWKDHDAYQKGFERILRDLKMEVTA